MKVSFAQKCPDKVHLWHREKNGDLGPEDVSCRSHKKVWWRCDKNESHEWEAVVYNISSGNGCPYCAGKRACVSNCLAKLRPDIALMWHPTKNGKLTPYDVTVKSGKKVWWQCDKDESHEWDEYVYNVIKINRGCPYCSGRRACVSNCLATLRPDVAKLWHPTKNGNLTPYNVTVYSGKNIWWQCNKNNIHEWETAVSHISNGRGCPYCAGQSVCMSNCLQTLRPDIALLWHHTKNGKLTPYDVTQYSNKKVWWQCSKNKSHEWQTTVNHITRGRGCPYCSGRRACVSNCLATLRPDIALLWHHTKNGKLTPYDVTQYSNKKVWWQCSKNNSHEWTATVSSVTKGTGCPTCNQPKGERWIESWLLTNNIQFTPQYKIPECKNKRPLPFDFAAFVNGNLMLIEFHGIQHFLPVDYFGGEKKLKYIQRNDKIKQSFCQQHNLPLLILDYTQSESQMQECMENFFGGVAPAEMK